MIVARLHGVPVPDGTALVAADPALADLAATAHLAVVRLLDFSVEVYVAAPLPEAAVVEPARLVARRAAAAATFPAYSPPVGPQGRWYAALVIWGWLALLAAAQSVPQVLGGLWLAVGLPWARRRQRRGTDGPAERAAGGLASALRASEAIPVRQLSHGGIQRLAAALEAAAGSEPERLRAAALACAPAGLPFLERFYMALAQGRRPDGIWAFIATADSPRPPAQAASASPVVVESERGVERSPTTASGSAR